MTNPDGPRVRPVFELIARALHNGEEGRDWRMLRRLPILDTGPETRAAA